LPKGADAAFIDTTARAYPMQPSNNGQSSHMNREFFTSHKSPVVFIFFIENGPKSLITIDEAGHLFVWRY